MFLRHFFAPTAAAFALFVAESAYAEVKQTGDGTSLPQPVPAAEIDKSMRDGWKRDTLTNVDTAGNNVHPGVPYGDLFPTFVDGDAVTLQGLFKWRNEKIDPEKDARTAPGFFSPTCGFSGELVLRGGDCNLAFGWYNVLDPNNPTPPTAGEIYELLPSNISEYMQCMTQGGTLQAETAGFCPLGWDRHHPYKMSQVAWTPKAFDSGMIATDPRYKGKYVAFALIGKPNSKCTQTKHSIAAHNQKNSSGQPWITTLIWQSTIDPEAFYIGFEDLPMLPSNWKDAGPGAGGCDGDFNDFVFYVSGINCQGGGQACDTGLQGACSLGRTDCSVAGEKSACRPIIQPGKELCDNVDNDCNGFVDDGMGLCPADQVCDKGSCVAACNTGEFKCTNGLECKNGFCIDAACASMMCPAGQACRQGACVNACDGVTCPAGQECQLGRCVDPCANIKCPGGRVCERGLCVSDCKCRGCSNGLVCGGDGRCADTMCANVTCPAGQKCQGGVCKDPCAGVVCPGGAQCVNGVCGDPMSSGGSTNGSAGGISIGNGGSLSIGTGGSTSSGNNSSTSGNGNQARREVGETGCSCRTVPSSTSRLGFGLAALAALGAILRRRRSAVR
ncbi:MAG: MYXO-CTERM sorting domain-containing protein [Myxococcota bacterium]